MLIKGRNLRRGFSCEIFHYYVYGISFFERLDYVVLLVVFGAS